MFLFVFWWGFLLQRWQMTRQGRDPELANRFVNWGIAGILLGAWFGHRFFYEWDKVLADPIYLIDVSKGLAGLASHGATVGLIVAMAWFARRNKIPVAVFIDSTTFSAALAGALVRLGNFFNSEIVGKPTDGTWGVCLPRYEAQFYPENFTPELVARHPTQLYEVGAALFLLGMLFLADRKFGGNKRPPWLLTSIYLIVYFVLRFIIEIYKEHQTLTEGWTMGQWLSIPGAAIGAVLLWYSLTRSGPSSDPQGQKGPPVEADKPQ